ncbi:MAG: hypothetical protein AAGF55_04085 [Pseudomonadota bacterium]
MTQVLRPNAAMLPGYVAALKRGWSPDNLRPETTKCENLAWIAKDADGFLASRDDPLEWPPESGPPTGIDLSRNWRISDGWETREARRYCIEASAS